MSGTPAPPPLARLLLDGFRWFETALLRRLAQAGYPGLTMSHSALFAALDRDGTRPAELARRLSVTRQSAHQTVHELVEMGLVELIRDPDDRRASLARLTGAGRDHVKVARRIFRDLERELERRIGARRVADLRKSLSLDWGDALVTKPDRQI
jgi:DNA-binding MarR family transcriptional regulator